MPTNLNKFKNQVCSIDNDQRDCGLWADNKNKEGHPTLDFLQFRSIRSFAKVFSKKNDNLATMFI